MRAWLQPFAAVVLALVLSALLLLALGADVGRAFGALLDGAFGNPNALENTLVRSVPLLLVGLGIAVAFRCGIWNIGGEGQLYVGALVATALATRLLAGLDGWLLVPATLLAGAAAGAGWAYLAALLKIHRNVSEVLSTILLNFVAVLAVAWAVHGPLQEAAAAYPQSDAFPDAARLWILPGLRRVHAGLLLALLLPGALWLLLFRSAAGLRLRAVGLAPDAARYAGISPEREAARVLLISGAFAGLAGAVEVSGVTGRLFENLSSGYGFTAIAVALLARLHPLGVIPAALFFAALATGSGAMQRVAGVPSVTVQVIEALVIFLSAGFALPPERALMDAGLIALLLSLIRMSTPLGIAAMGELVAERAGVLNIGIEGMMLTGAFAAYAAATHSDSTLLATLCAAAAGAALAAVFALFVLERRADPIVCGTALNILALGATGTAHRWLFPADGTLRTAAHAPELLPGLNVFVVFAVLLVVVVAFFLARTRAGLSLRAVGENAEAAHAQGVGVLPMRWAATVFGGACAGVAGATLVLWISDVFVEGMTTGRGFIALSLVLFGGYRPLRIVAGALLFGAASALQFRLQALGLELPYNLLLMTPYLLTLLVLAVFAGRVRPPADLARPFES